MRKPQHQHSTQSKITKSWSLERVAVAQKKKNKSSCTYLVLFGCWKWPGLWWGCVWLSTKQFSRWTVDTTINSGHHDGVSEAKLWERLLERTTSAATTTHPASPQVTSFWALSWPGFYLYLYFCWYLYLCLYLNLNLHLHLCLYLCLYL